MTPVAGSVIALKSLNSRPVQRKLPISCSTSSPC
ncbi:hypothetical protein LARI1_G007500 [Lachnellula arida]|uniref:Uncharacterized protein n=1 Tax=Lachnellula arida TaxID=1316785 RepID=A0A8T9B2E7_9HELO|nr:hypothetical protein LARI1_G007500 [Lachnellula arida]